MSKCSDHSKISIIKDYDRTFPHLNVFKEDPYSGNNPLVNVLIGYAGLDKDVGYC
jgi:hypothetical protein